MKVTFKISFVFLLTILITLCTVSLTVQASEINNDDYNESYLERTSKSNLIVEEGIYFIKNGHLDKYVQIDDGDSSNNYNTEGAILELWTGTGVSYQKWIFEYLDNGYYKIESYKSEKVIAVEAGNENSSNDALVQQTYNGSYRQQWKITLTSSGKYKIKARSSEPYSTDRVMCCGEGIGGNGRNVEQREYSNNSYYKDEWILETILPISGFEKSYQPSLWNYQPVQNGTNCFSYAFNNQVYSNTNNLFWMNPTYSNGNVINKSDIQIDTIEGYISNVTNTHGLLFEEINENTVCPTGTYKVALVIDPGTDYHWYRQNPDGTWSHKPGQGAVTNLDASDNIIINPRLANRDHSYNAGCIHIELNYTEFIGYYKVTPTNNMYNPNRSLSNELICFDNNISVERDYLKAIKIKNNMTYSEVVEIIGLPQFRLTFGLMEVGYMLSNGDLLSIEFNTNNNGNIYVKNIDFYNNGEK